MRLAPLFWVLPTIALLAGLHWLIDHDEKARHRDDLKRDALWVEQTLQFQIESQQSRLDRAAQDMSATTFVASAFAPQAADTACLRNSA
jgi:hypothetical protein